MFLKPAFKRLNYMLKLMKLPNKVYYLVMNGIPYICFTLVRFIV